MDKPPGYVPVPNTIPFDELLAEFEADPEFAKHLAQARVEFAAWLAAKED